MAYSWPEQPPCSTPKRRHWPSSESSFARDKISLAAFSVREMVLLQSVVIVIGCRKWACVSIMNLLVIFCFFNLL